MKSAVQILLFTLTLFVFRFSGNAQEDTSNETFFDSPKLSFTGLVFSDLYAPFKNFDDEEFRQASVNAWLTLTSKFGSRIGVTATPTVRVFQASIAPELEDEWALLGLREAYAFYSSEGWTFRLGHQIHSWGKADGFNPTDVVMARDYRLLSAHEETQYRGSTSIWISWTPQYELETCALKFDQYTPEGWNSLCFEKTTQTSAVPFTLTLIATPILERSRLSFAPLQLPAEFTISGQNLPSRKWSNIETAFKFSYFGKGWDLSLIAFRGFDHLPELEETPGSGPGSFPINWQQVFRRLLVAGGNFSTSFDDWVVTLDASYKWTENNQGKDPRKTPSHLEAVAGLEKEFSNHFSFQTQAYIRYIPRFKSISTLSSPTDQALASANTLLHNAQQQFRPASMLRLGYETESGRFGTEILGIYYYKGRDYFIRPKVYTTIADRLRITAGLDYFGGESDTTLGALEPFNSAFLEMRAWF